METMPESNTGKLSVFLMMPSSCHLFTYDEILSHIWVMWWSCCSRSDFLCLTCEVLLLLLLLLLEIATERLREMTVKSGRTLWWHGITKALATSSYLSPRVENLYVQTTGELKSARQNLNHSWSKSRVFLSMPPRMWPRSYGYDFRRVTSRTVNVQIRGNDYLVTPVGSREVKAWWEEDEWVKRDNALLDQSH